MARDIPIIFSAQMVQALLAGRKTMTRRLATSPLRHAKPGDRLWVRESLKHVSSDPVTAEPCSLHCYMASIPAGMDSANPYEDNYLFPEEGDVALKPKSIPSIHMPRWASRLTLVITQTIVERLQDMSEVDMLLEGVTPFVSGGTKMFGIRSVGGYEHAGLTPKETFVNLWCALHGPSAWNDNPEVVALAFRVICANIDAAEALAA